MSSEKVDPYEQPKEEQLTYLGALKKDYDFKDVRRGDRLIRQYFDSVGALLDERDITPQQKNVPGAAPKLSPQEMFELLRTQAEKQAEDIFDARIAPAETAPTIREVFIKIVDGPSKEDIAANKRAARIVALVRVRFAAIALVASVANLALTTGRAIKTLFTGRL